MWLNTPQPPLEASGTSGMKAALNGVPQHRLDGWWIEGCIEGVTGWAIGNDPGAGDAADNRVERRRRAVRQAGGRRPAAVLPQPRSLDHVMRTPSR